MLRYARQQAIEGWDQDKLKGATLAIVGAGPTAFFAGLMATAMGFGRLVLIGERVASPIGVLNPANQAPVHFWTKLFNTISPETQIYPLERRADECLIGRLPALDGLIVCGNDLQTRDLGWKIAQDSCIPVVAGGTTAETGFWGSPCPDEVVARFQEHPESPLLSQIVAALLVDEMRKALMSLPGEEGRSARRNLLHFPYFARSAAVRSPRLQQRPHIVLVGAGALGTWFGLGLGMGGLNAEMHIYDGDDVDETNLNRQVLFFGAVGRPKAPVLAERLQQLFPSLGLKAYGMQIGGDNAPQLRDGSILVACPDNFAARSLLNQFACRGRHALLNGGTGAMGGSCMVYAPGYSACLSCRLHIERLAQLEQEAHSCARQVASVVTSNAIIGALLAWSVREMLAGRVTQSIWEYDGRARNQRLGLHSRRPACPCHLQN